ncbi:MAG: hypothetical protein EB009_04915 [Actinobacteria bacterium]|nr:hypothetical protein [Actinomycetota bacterium]NBY50252.1 hypothetical protein [Actinomycetota bacterium]NCU83123.1 hypothetical protein [Actinomycetota bacterium]NCU84085.1 hypothetical protein [Actinomycetota bacterium]NCY10500.1 hypothetical protein [Actinomycetota bacterium]
MPSLIQYLEDFNGETPFIRWFFESLTQEEQDFVDFVLDGVLSSSGIDLLSGNWLKDLGDNLYQLRLRILGSDGRARILLRVFLTFFPNDEILIISGYCKLRNPGSANQKFEIDRAKQLLKQWKSKSDTMWNPT